MKQLINEIFNVVPNIRKTSNGKEYMIVYVDKNTSTDDTFAAKDTIFKNYGMQYLPKCKELFVKGKLLTGIARYMPHAWGWFIWGDPRKSPYIGYIKKFIQDLPLLETPPSDGQKRDYQSIMSNFDDAIRQMIDDTSPSDFLSQKKEEKEIDPKIQAKVDDFKKLVRDGFDRPETKLFLEGIMNFKKELMKHDIWKLGWNNMLTALASRDWKATEVRSKGEWYEMGWIPREGVPPIVLIGKGAKYSSFSPKEKEKITNDFLAKKGVNSVSELYPSAGRELKRILKGRKIYGSDYLYNYLAYDKADLTERTDIPPEKIERDEKAPEGWYSKLKTSDKDKLLTESLVKFAQSPECGSLIVVRSNTQAGLNGARGNATSRGVINLVNDDYIDLPTAVHELLHSLKHLPMAYKNNESLKKFYSPPATDKEMEQEADLCAAFVVSNYFSKEEYDIQPHMNYIASWGANKSNSDKTIDNILIIANFIIKGIDKYANWQANYQMENTKKVFNGFVNRINESDKKRFMDVID